LIFERKLKVAIVRIMMAVENTMLTPMHRGINQWVYDIGCKPPFSR
jgi:hypothetical protein